MSLYRFDEVKQAFSDVNDLLLHLKQFQNKYNRDFPDALETFCEPIKIGYLYHLKLDQHIEECFESCDKILKYENRIEKQKKYLYHPSFKTTIQHLCKDNLFVIFRFCDDHDLSCLQNVSRQWRVLSLSSPGYKWQAPSSLPSNFKTITLSQYQYMSIIQYSDYIKHFDTNCIKYWKDLPLHRLDHMVVALKNIQTLHITVSEHVDNETVNRLLYLCSIHCPLLHLIQLGAHYQLKEVKQKFVIHSHNSLKTISTHHDDHYDTMIEIIHPDSLRSVHKLPESIILYSRINTLSSFQNLVSLIIMFMDVDVTQHNQSLFPTLKHLTVKRNNRRIGNNLRRSELPSLSISAFGFHSSFLDAFALHFPVLQSIHVEFLDIPKWRDEYTFFRDPALREEPYMEVIQNPQVQFDLQFIQIQLISLLRECSKTLCDITLNQLWTPLFWTASTYDQEEGQRAQRDFLVWRRQVSEIFPCPSSQCATLCTIDPSVVKNVHIHTTTHVPFMWSVDDSKASHTMQVSIKNRLDKSFHYYYSEDRWLSQLPFGIPLPVQARVYLDHTTVSVGMDHVSKLNVCSTDFFIHQCKVQNESELDNSWFHDPAIFSSKFNQIRQLSLQFPHMGMIYLFQRPQYFLHLQHLPFLQSVKLDIEFRNSNAMWQKPDLAFIPTLSLHARSLPALESVDTLGFHVAWVDGGEVSISLKSLVVMHGCSWTHMDDVKNRELCLDVSSEVSLDLISQYILKVIPESQIQSQCPNVQLHLIDLPHLELVHLCYLRNREFQCETLFNQCCIRKCPRLKHVALESSTLISTPLKLEHSVNVCSLPSLLILEESLFGDNTFFHFADNPALQMIFLQTCKTPELTSCILQWMQQKAEGLVRLCCAKNISQKDQQILLDGSEYIESAELVLQSLGLEKDKEKGFHFKDKEGMIVKQQHAIHPSLVSLLETSVRCLSFLSYFENSKFHIPPPNYIVSKNTCLYFRGMISSSQNQDVEDYEYD